MGSSAFRCRYVRGSSALVALALVLAADEPPVRAQALGRLEGRVDVVVHGRKKLSSMAYPARRASAPPTSVENDAQRVVVYVKSPRLADADARPMQRRIRQVQEVFVPGLVAITRGSTVEFPNDDRFFHNVFSLSRAATFDLGRYPQGETRAHRFPEAGFVKVYCHIHPHMTAVVAVFDHPHFANVDAQGRFVLDKLPPGDLVVAAWHERAGEASLPVTITAGGTTRATIALPLSDAR